MSISIKNPFKNESAPEAEKWLSSNVQGHIEDDYFIGKVIGKGAFSTIRIGQHKHTRRESAIKFIAKKQAFQHMNLATEIRVLKKLSKHPNVNEFFGLYDSFSDYEICLELAKGGDLLDVLIKRIESGAQYTEAEVALILKQVISATHHCHKNGVLHRDLKPENLLVSTEDGNVTDEITDENGKKSLLLHPVKLCDFGLAAEFTPGEKLNDLCGTASYMAPERLNNEAYDESSDIWSIGVIMYCLLAGEFPFDGKTVKEVRNSVTDPGTPYFSAPIFSSISDSCITLLRDHLLNKDPTKRPTAEDLLKHPWITGVEASNTEMKDALKVLKSFNARRKFKGTVMALIATNRMKHVLDGIRCEKLLVDLIKIGLNAEKLLPLNMKFNETDSSQFISKEQFVNCLSATLNCDETLPTQLFDVMKRNNIVDGRSVCLALASKVCGTEQECFELAFELFDTDSSGEIDFDEYTNMMQTMLTTLGLGQASIISEESLKEQFDTTDTDGNGSIDKQEFLESTKSNPKIRDYFKSVWRILPGSKLFDSKENLTTAVNDDKNNVISINPKRGHDENELQNGKKLKTIAEEE